MADKILSTHEKYMRRCLELAELGNGFVAPNPMVGAVLVHGDRIIGEGYHQVCGQAHAEVNCIASVSEEDRALIAQSTLYVSLEPCAHTGKTPPCADLIIRHNIPKVVISVTDPFDAVNGKGIARLRKNGVEVITGVLEQEGRQLLKHFLYFHQHNLPFVTLKFAQSRDGFIGQPKKRIAISGPLAQRYVHQLRARHQGILVGSNTVLTDNPALTVRQWHGQQPVRIVVGKQEKIPADYAVFDNSATTVFISGNTMMEVLKNIAERGIISVLIEGGAHILQQCIDAQLWQEACIITGPDDLQEGISAPAIQGIVTDTFPLANDRIQLLKNPHAVFTA